MGRCGSEKLRTILRQADELRAAGATIELDAATRQAPRGVDLS
ncbi:MAG TPA: hypothetical protein VFN24_11015 [Microbacterium sp.]|jgi:hypothetical protein|nr:hypothetical protein [Microbacterium sp.]